MHQINQLNFGQNNSESYKGVETVKKEHDKEIPKYIYIYLILYISHIYIYIYIYIYKNDRKLLIICD